MGRTRPRGPALQVTSAWRALVEERLAARSWNYSELARHIKVSPAAISKLLGTEVAIATSRLVAPISSALDLAPPTAPISGQEAAEWLAIGEALAAEDHDVFIRLLVAARARLDAVRKVRESEQAFEDVVKPR